MKHILEAELWPVPEFVNQFATLNDAGYYEDMAALFAEDGRFASPLVPDTFITGRRAITLFFEERRKENQQASV